MKKALFGILSIIGCIACILGLSSCSNYNSDSAKYGDPATYYDMNGLTFSFDGHGNCTIDNLNCTYEIQDDTYLITYEETGGTLTFKKVNNDCLIQTSKNINAFLRVPIRTGYVNAKFLVNSTIIQLNQNGSFYLFDLNMKLIGSGYYYFNNGVLALNSTLSNQWLAFYVHEQTGQLYSVAIKNPSYYKQWHFQQHTLTYDFGYNQLVEKWQVTYGENVYLKTPKRPGYKFLGWYYLNNQIDSGFWNYDCDVTLTAKWEEISSDDPLLKFRLISDNHTYYYIVSGYKGSPQHITIPTTREDGILIKEIGNDAFEGCSSLTSVTIPEGVTSIGYDAFSGCSSLTSVTIPEGVTSIGHSAFNDCGNLTSVTIPSSVTSIGDYAFYNCYSLTSVTIPEGVTSIRSYTFRGCSNLTSVTIPSSVTSIGENAFYNCSSLKGVYITDIAKWCAIRFGGIDANPLRYANNLYLNNELVTELVIPEGVTSIGNYVFSGCSSLTSVTIPNSVTSIGSSAFYDCSSLTSITIPEGVTSIGSYAFYGCNNLNGVYITDIAKWCAISFGNGGANPLYYANNLYLNNELVTELVIPEGVTSIGDYAFYNCSNLMSITISSGVTSIGSSAFSGCSNLMSVTISSGVTSIGSSAFSGCSSLIRITIPNSVTSIGNSAFEGCSSLTSITIPNSVTSIGRDAFSGCSRLKDVYITDIAKWCAISFGNSDANPLRYADNLYLNNELVTELVIPEGVTSIGDYAFRGCSSLTSVTISSGAKNIGSSAFNGCSSLTSVTIPSSVIYIHNNAFSSCNNLKTIYYKGTITEWNNVLVGNGFNSNIVYYYSASKPTDSNNYWHYDVDGITPIVWKNE